MSAHANSRFLFEAGRDFFNQEGTRRITMSWREVKRRRDSLSLKITGENKEKKRKWAFKYFLCRYVRLKIFQTPRQTWQNNKLSK